MTNDKQTEVFKEKATAYAEEFLRGFSDTISQFYAEAAGEVIKNGYPWIYLTLYKKTLGKDISAIVFCTQYDFFFFFTKPTDDIVTVVNEFGNETYSKEWSDKTPQQIKLAQIKDVLKLNGSITIDEPIHIGGTAFILEDLGNIRRNAENHGGSRADLYGQTTVQFLPQLRDFVKNTSSKLIINKRYQELKNDTGMSPQKKGHAFEALWRELLNLYGWQAKKINLSGEGNDFTAIFDGHHILGEVRWEKQPLNGEEIHAFAGKLAPRPQTIGLVISHSGFDKGAYDVVKRHISNRTIVFFNIEHIEKIIVRLTDPGEVFSLELRNVYDYLFEKVSKTK